MAQAASVTVDFVPVASSVKAGGDFVQGKDSITGDPVSRKEIAAMGALGVIIPKALQKFGKKAFDKVKDLFKKSDTPGGPSAKDISDQGSKVEIVDRDGDTVELIAEKGDVKIEAMARMTKDGDTLNLDKLHMNNVGEGKIKRSDLDDMAKTLGSQEGASTVKILPGTRTSGAMEGRTPKPREIKVDEPES